MNIDKKNIVCIHVVGFQYLISLGSLKQHLLYLLS